MVNTYNIKYDYLKFTGNDRLDLLNRISTNEVRNLNKFECIKTILTSEKGRFIDILTIFNFGDFLFALCSIGNSKNVMNHLEKYTIMDDFKVQNLSKDHVSILLFGDDCGIKVSEYFGMNELINNEFKFTNTHHEHAILSRNDNPLGGFIYTYADSAEPLDLNSNVITDEEFEILRIENLIPKFGNEITDITNPLECGLEKYISFTKGCYIGQEVIARLDSYDKVSKHLVYFESNYDLASTNTTQLKFVTDNKECGFITSMTANGDESIGLGFIKTVFLDEGKEYYIKKDTSLFKAKIKVKQDKHILSA